MEKKPSTPIALFFNVVKAWEYSITTDTIMLILLQKFIRQIVNAQSNTLLYSRSVNIIIPRVYNLKNGHGYSILLPVILS